MRQERERERDRGGEREFRVRRRRNGAVLLLPYARTSMWGEDKEARVEKERE